MKKLILSTLFFALTAIVFVQCNKNFKNETSDDLVVDFTNTMFQVPLNMGGIYYKNIILPEGTTKLVTGNSHKVEFEYPDNYVYLYQGRDGNTKANGGGCWDCHSACTGDGCDVILVGATFACTACADEGECNGSSCDNISKGFLVDLNLGIHPIREDVDVNPFSGSYSNVTWEVLVGYPEIQDNLRLFISNLWNEKRPNTKEGSPVLVSVYGYKVLLLYPKEIAKQFGDKSPTCSCLRSKGPVKGTCTLNEITSLGEQIGWECTNNDCNTCRMNTK